MPGGPRGPHTQGCGLLAQGTNTALHPPRRCGFRGRCRCPQAAHPALSPAGPAGRAWPGEASRQRGPHTASTPGAALRESPRVTQRGLAPRSEGSLGCRPRGTGRASLAGSTARLVPPPQARAGRAGPQAGTWCGSTPGSHSTTEPHPRNSSSGAARKEEKRLPFAPIVSGGGCEEGRERGERGGERRGGGRSGDGLRDSGSTWPRGGQRQGSWGPQIRCRCPGGL